jgi:hypothetical protein
VNLPNLREESRYIGLPAHVRNVAEVLAVFDRDLYIEQLPSSHPQFNPQMPWSVTHRPPGKEAYVVKNCAEGSIDARLVAEFIEGTNRLDGQSGWDAYEALEKAWEIMSAKKRQEEAAEQREKIADLARVGDKYHYAKHNGRRLHDSGSNEDLAPKTIYLGR